MNTLSRFYKDKYILLVFLLAFLFAGLFGRIDIIPLLGLISIQFAFVFLPGFLLHKKLNIEYKDNISSLFVSYALGFAMMIVIYAVLLFFNIQSTITYFAYAISATSIITYFVNGYYKEKSISSPSLAMNASLFVIMLIIGFIVFQFPNQSAEVIGYQNMGNDPNYWFKNCVAATKGYPIPELSVNGLHLYWHMFSCFAVAIMHFCTGIEIYEICYSLSYIWDTFLFLGGTYVLANELLNNKKFVVYACIILLLCTCIEPFNYLFYLEHMYGCKLGCTVGQSMSLFAILFMSRLYDNSGISNCLIALLFFMCTLGAKSSNGSVVLCMAGIFLLIHLIKKRNVGRTFTIGLLYLGIFVLVSKIFLIDDNALTSDSSSHKMVFSLVTAVRNPMGNKIFVFLSGFIGQYIAFAIAFCVFIMTMHYIIVPLGFFALYVIFKKKISLQLLDIVLLCGAIVGFGLFLFMNHPGLSQMYFAFAALPFALLFSFRIFERTEIVINHRFWKYIKTVVVFSLVTSVILLPKTFCTHGTYRSNHNIVCSDNGFGITKSEIEGLRWVRDNLPEDIVVVTNKIIQGDKYTSGRSFITSAYSERQTYMEGWGSTNLPSKDFSTDRLKRIQDFFHGKIKAKKQLLNEGVSYAILFKGMSAPNENLGTCVFENNSMVIYKL